MNHSNHTRRDLNEVVFENRNKAYGAYALRKEEDKRTIIGLLFTCLVFAAFAVGSQFGGKDPVKSLIGTLDNNKVDSTIIIEISNPWDDKVVETKKEIASNPKTENPNYQAAKIEDDSIKTVSDFKQLVIGPKSDDTTGKGGPDVKGIVVIKKPEPIDTIPVTYTPNMPKFNGDFLNWIRTSTNYPQMAKDNDISGVVYVNFVVNENGDVSNLKVLNPKANELLKNEALRVVKSSPKWTPGNDGSRNVRVSMTVPIHFKLK